MMQICLKSLRSLLLVLLAAQASLLGMSQVYVDSQEDAIRILGKPEVRELLEVLLEVGDESILLDEQQRAALLSSCMQCNQGAIHEVFVCLSFIKQLICTKFALLDTHLSQVDASLCTKLASLLTTVTTGDAIICSKIDDLDFGSTSGIDQILENLSVHDASVCAKLVLMQGNELVLSAQMIDAVADATQSMDDNLASATDEIISAVSVHDVSVCGKILALQATELLMNQQLVNTLSTHDANVCTKIQSVTSLEDAIIQQLNAFASTEQVMNAQILTSVSSGDAQICTKLNSLSSLSDSTAANLSQHDVNVCGKIANLEATELLMNQQLVNSLSTHDAVVCTKIQTVTSLEDTIIQQLNAFASTDQAMNAQILISVSSGDAQICTKLNSLASISGTIAVNLSQHDVNVCGKIANLEATELLMNQQLVNSLSTHDASVCTKIQTVTSLEDDILQELNAFESTEQLMNAQILASISAHDASVCTKLITLQNDLTTLSTQQNDMFAILNSKIDLLLP